MTLGEKIRQARGNCGLSQQQLAEKLAVSRSAIAKWETDKGLPDVGNLKLLARLLNVSVDHLLDDEKTAEEPVIREPYCLTAYGNGCKKVRKDRLVCEKFPDAKVYTLFARPERTDLASCAGNLPDCCPGVQNTTRQTDRAFYLVEKEECWLLVTVTDAFIEIRRLKQNLDHNHFQFNGWDFIKYNYELTK